MAGRPGDLVQRGRRAVNGPLRDGAPYTDNAEHLRDELDRVACLVRAQLLRLKAARPEPTRERYWHLSDADLEALAHEQAHSPLALFDVPAAVAPLRAQADAHRAAIDARLRASRGTEVVLRLPRLARQFGLGADDCDALLLALLPALHSNYRHWYSVLQLDANGQQPSVGLLVEMLAASAADAPRLLAALGSTGPLARARLVVLGGGDDEPLAVRSVSVDERLSRHLCGDDALDARLQYIACVPAPRTERIAQLPLPAAVTHRLAALPDLRISEPELWRRLRLGCSGPDPQLVVQACAAVAAGSGLALLTLDVAAALAGALAWPAVIELALREARLRGALPMFTAAARLLDADCRPQLSQLLGRLALHDGPVALELGDQGTPPAHDGGEWLMLRLDAPGLELRERLWAQRLAAAPHAVADPQAVIHALAHAFRFTGSQIDEAWRQARAMARLRSVYGAPVGADDLFMGCRQQSARQLVAFAQRIEPRPALTLEHDVVLPPASLRVLAELRTRIRNHRRVQGAMDLGHHMRLARGVTALFVGGSGTGKTMAAEVLASEQNLDLYRIDLGSLVSKWVGETEKNLSRIFADAERANCMLFFDEADALFGRRGEVQGGQDRWANNQVNHLLQVIEEYSGVVILATNLRQHLDDAFQRRIHVVVDFPAPDPASRHALWNRLLPQGARRGVSAQDLDEIAQRFDMSGGNIRNAVLDACYRAIEEGQAAVTTRHLAASVAREFQKSGRPVMQGEFGRYYDWAMQDVVVPLPIAARG